MKGKTETSGKALAVSDSELEQLYRYAVKIRREIHQNPELGFELEQTEALVAGELAKMGYQPTDRYGVCSVSAEVGEGARTVAFRADMDALPIEELCDLPFRSAVKGRMHACGHDAHTAVLLAVASHLKRNEMRLTELGKRIRFIFQPSEECEISGAEMMVDNGVMEGVEHIVALHCENGLDSGRLGVCDGYYMSACIPAVLKFFGKSSHATIPEAGIDALAMAVEAYTEMRRAVAEEAADEPYVWCVGRLAGGKAHNVISDEAEMNISFRYYDTGLARRVESRVRAICDSVAARYGGRYELDWRTVTEAVYCDPALTAGFRRKMSDAGIEVSPLRQRMSSEDFAHYLSKAPGYLFRFGTRNEKLGCTALAHRSDFMIDEEGMRYAIKAFCTLALTP